MHQKLGNSWFKYWFVAFSLSNYYLNQQWIIIDETTWIDIQYIEQIL